MTESDDFICIHCGMPVSGLAWELSTAITVLIACIAGMWTCDLETGHVFAKGRCSRSHCGRKPMENS